jgi:uncharacterized PurR-regulated membrane protein YhhQ (DUF165 family)
MRRAGLVAAAVYILTIVAANWAVNRFGAVPVGFGLAAPAGVYFAGVAFTVRDIVQETLGRHVVALAILVGAAVSYLVSSGRIAEASALAFLVSEGADFLVYTPLRSRGWLAAVVASNIVGAAVDSLLFLVVAFGSATFFWGQFVGKLWLTAATIVLAALARGAVASTGRAGHVGD